MIHHLKITLLTSLIADRDVIITLDLNFLIPAISLMKWIMFIHLLSPKHNNVRTVIGTE